MLPLRGSNGGRKIFHFLIEKAVAKADEGDTGIVAGSFHFFQMGFFIVDEEYFGGKMRMEKLEKSFSFIRSRGEKDPLSK